jgi:hypothetical protein
MLASIIEGCQVATEQELAEVRHMIESFYQFAAIPLPSNFQANEYVAEVFGTMLNRTQRCSRAFAWVPRPPGGRASIAWLAMQLGRGVFDSYRSQLSFTCARAVIASWGRKLQDACYGAVNKAGLPAWA